MHSLLGTEIGNNGWIATAWCVTLTVPGYRWSTAQFNRDRNERLGCFLQPVPLQGGVLRHRVGVRRPVGLLDQTEVGKIVACGSTILAA